MSHSAFRSEVRGYDAVRRAARDSATYSSDLVGDNDVRTYRQLPLEADPPWHAKVRLLLAPYFAKENIAPMQGDFAKVARGLVDSLSDRESFDVGRDFALPYVMGCLGIIFNRTQDVDEWTSWGPDVWLAGAHMRGEPLTAETLRAMREREFSTRTQRSGDVLEAYLNRVLDEAQQSPVTEGPPADIWRFLVGATIDGQPLSRQDTLGIGNILLAGGRGTLVKLVTGTVWHLTRSPEDRAYLSAEPDQRGAAIQELARYLSPLAKIARVRRDGPNEELVMLNYVSANHDTTVFIEPGTLNLRRSPIPNVAFGFGRHFCLGVHVAQVEMLALLDVLLTPWPGWVFAQDPVITWATEENADSEFTVLDRFQSVRLTAEPGAKGVSRP